MSGCDRRCYEIGGPWITFDPECPVHGNDAQREAAEREAREQREADAFAALVARVEALERKLEEQDSELRRVRRMTGTPPRGMPC